MLKKIMAKANANKKNQKGFTLIELLAVIVILAILAAIAIPSIVSIIHKQNDKAKVQDAITVIHAAKLFVADHNVDGSSTITIKKESAGSDSGATNVASSEGWGDYASKSTGTISDTIIVYYNPTNESYSITDSSLSGVGGSITGTSDKESTLIDYNK